MAGARRTHRAYLSVAGVPVRAAGAASMYSVFLPFGAVVIDLFLVFMYFKHDFWLLGGATAIFALFPLLVTTFLLYSKWTRLKLVSLLLFISPKTQTIGPL